MKSTLLFAVLLTLLPTPASGGWGNRAADDACREAQREVQLALGELDAEGADAAVHGVAQLRRENRRRREAKQHHRVVAALEFLREYAKTHEVARSCMACIVREFARDVPIGEQAPCGTHDVCVSGWRLRADDDCVERVCQRKPFCCAGWWTERCTRAAERACGISCDACEHDGCSEGVVLHRECGDCVTRVCNSDPYCCDTAWDSRCVQYAQEACAEMCVVTTTTTTSTTSTTSTTTTTVIVRPTDAGCLSATDCDDGNVCTNDFCETDGSCTHRNNRVPCEDGNLCTLNDQCAFGTCRGGARMNCDDGSACTFDWCHSSGECRHRTISCNDADRCTIDRCDPAVGCRYATVDCDDGDACTIDDCRSSLGCVSTPDTTCSAP